MPVEMAEPITAQAYRKETARIPLGQLSHGRASRTIRNNMRGIKYGKNTRSNISVAPNVRNYARHATRSVSPQPLKAWGGLIARRASRHARRKHGRRYRSQHTRR